MEMYCQKSTAKYQLALKTLARIVANLLSLKAQLSYVFSVGQRECACLVSFSLGVMHSSAKPILTFLRYIVFDISATALNLQ